MLTNISIADLNRMDLGAHLEILQEWNEETKFHWEPATISLCGMDTVVCQEDGIGGLIVAVYRTGGEGDLLSLRIYAGRDDHHGIEYYRVKP